MGYNVLTDAFLENTTSGIPGYSPVMLTSAQLRDLVSGNGSIVVGAGEYIGISAELGVDLLCNQLVIISNQEASFINFYYKEFVGNEFSSHGQYNPNTGYATPIMQSNLLPEPYYCDQSSVYSSNYAYKAFNQTANDSSDCWHSAFPISFPQSIMFYFPYGKVINKYALQCRNHGPSWTNRHFPRDFQLQGSVVDDPDVDNDSHWETLDSREDVEDPGQSAWTSYFMFENAKSYFYYRLRVGEANTGSDAVALANLKLVEAQRPESVPVYHWYETGVTWSGGVYRASFDGSVEEIKLFIGGPVTLSSVQLLATSGIVVPSGVVASGTYVDNYLMTHQTLDPKAIEIKNHMDGWAEPHLLFKYTGVYDVDRNIFISPDYPTSYTKNDATWYGIDYGYTYPELDDFNYATLSGTVVSERSVVIEDTQVSGSWTSPVFDTYNDLRAAYLYTKGEAELYVRASDDPPPMVYFLIFSTDNTHRWLMYDHKRVFIDSHGEIIGSNICDAPEVGNKIWRWADTDWTASDLHYHGSINDYGTASFLAPGYLECADLSPEQEFDDPDYWYNLNVCKLHDNSEWSLGATVSGLDYGEGVTVAMTKTFPVAGCNGFFCFTAVSNENDFVSFINLSFQQEGVTRGSYSIITVDGLISASDRIDVAYDRANNGWWVYMTGYLYKIDPGSINNVRVFYGPGKAPIYQGYIWKKSVNSTWKRIIAIPDNDYSYFWAISDTKIFLCEERYTTSEVEIIVHNEIDQGIQVDSGFVELWQGSCDEEGNLWVLDMAQEWVIRVGFQKALRGDARAVEYENQISGVLGVWAHPSDDTCFILIADEPEYPNQDIIRMVHVSQRWGARGKYVCAVPGFSSEDYRYGVSFVGKTFSDKILPHRDNSVWGVGEDTLEWKPYHSNGSLLPRGRYKQLKVVLKRDSVSQSSPRLERVRIPHPILLQPMYKGQTETIAVKTTFDKVRTPGGWDTKLLTWWYNKEL